MHKQVTVLAAAIMLAPLGAQGPPTSWVVGEGVLPPGGRGAREVMAAFEQATGNKVELIFYEQPDFRTSSRRR